MNDEANGRFSRMVSCIQVMAIALAGCALPADETRQIQEILHTSHGDRLGRLRTPRG